MRQFSVIVVMALLVVAALLSCKTVENVVKQTETDAIILPSNQGPIDPLEVIEKWKYVNYATMGGCPVWFYSKPDEEAEIIYTTVMVLFSEIFGYSYFLNGAIYLYLINDETNEYELRNCDQENWLYTYSLAFGIDARTGC